MTKQPKKNQEAGMSGRYCRVAHAANVLGCSPRTITNAIKSGILMAININAFSNPKRMHFRVIIRLDRPYDSTRRKSLTLEEAARLREHFKPTAASAAVNQ